MTTNLNELVEDLIRRHEGGEVFFENLDKAVQKPLYMEALYKAFSKHPDHFWDPIIVVSGEFGRQFSNWHNTIFAPYIHVFQVEGGLRHSGHTDSLEPYRNLIRGRKVVFLDDSYYSGATRKAIQKAVKRLGGTLIATFVVYDGSKEKHPNVHSLYRYYKERTGQEL